LSSSSSYTLSVHQSWCCSGLKQVE
jgi:hypothetical protein